MTPAKLEANALLEPSELRPSSACAPTLIPRVSKAFNTHMPAASAALPPCSMAAGYERLVIETRAGDLMILG